MNQQLSNIELLIRQSALTDEEKQKLLKEISNADKQWNILEFKLDRTEKVKKTTAVLLEETIEELEKKRKDVEAQNKELEIQNALERVRAVALGMKEPADMLEICSTIANQLQLLLVKEIRNVQTAIFYEDKGTYMNYEYYAKHDKTFITETSYTNHKMHKAFAEQMLKGKGEFFTTYISKNELPDWIAYQKTTNVFIDTFLETASSLSYYWFSLGAVALGISTYEPLNEEETNLFKRFLKVFELSYTRYLDIEQAIAQARESQIQLALERVRARTMAMQKSDELSDTVYVLFQQFKELGENPDQATIGVINEDENVIEYWVTMYGQPINKVFKFSIDEPNVTNKIYKAWKENKRSLVIDLSGNALSEFMTYRAGKGGAAANPNEKRRIINVAFFSKGLLNVQSNEERSEESIKLLERFAAVFEQTYTRFLDLQKAEAQAREAEIELGLERVRARAMAMQTSEELNALIGTVFTELTKLDLVLTRCVILIYEGNEKGVRWWMANSETPSTPMNFFVKYADLPFFNEYLKGWYNRELKWQYCLENENKIKTDDFLFNETELSLLPDFVIDGMRAPNRVYLNASFNNFGNLTLATLEPLSEEHFNILLRFAKVFDLTYTRFNDLKQAEAQAKESQIQLALERVRARTMAMQKSDELADTAAILFSQFKNLGYTPDRITIGIMQEEKQILDLWATSGEAGEPRQFYQLPFNEPHVLSKCVKAWNEQKKSLVLDISGEPLKEYTKFWKSFVPTQDARNKIDQVVFNFAFFSKGYLGFISFEHVPKQTIELLERFASVFDLTYTRFLDLQKAEDQAREAHIEAALERVRSRSLAMHNSTELKEVIRVVLQQFVHLNINVEHAGFYIDYKTQDDMHIWLADPNIEPFFAIIPYFDTPTWNSFLDAKAKGRAFHTDLLDFEEKNKFYQSLFKLFTVPEEAKQFYLECKGLAVSTVLLDNVGLYIENFSAIPYTDEENKILMRFGKVFQQTYTRFLDLQKAEAQAREAQIEAALERVRSRTMAMHKSDELTATAEILFDQLRQLGAELQGVAFAICDENSLMVQKWTSIGIFSHPYNIEPGEQRMYEAWKNGEGYYEEVYEGERQKKYYEAFMQIPEFKQGIQKFIDSGYPLPTWQKNHAVTFKYGYLLFITLKPFDETNIFIRFGKVFEQTYTRFLDLQKAEAQTREAQIEAALERVRSKAMSMQNSQDLSDTIGVFYRELQSFSLTPRRCGVGLLDREDRIGEMFTWNTTEQGDSLELVGRLKMEGHPVLNKIYESWLTQKEYHPVLRGNEIKKYYEIIKPQIAFPDYTHNDVQFGYFFFFPEGGVYAWTEKEMQEDELQIYRRFTSVLSLTYKRYRDLQKAETNAREAIKQAALDRIRADIASMRTINDLDRITPLIWNELTILGIPFIRCGVFIMDDNQQLIHTFLSSPDGKAIAAFHLPYSTPGNIQKVISHWHDDKSYIDHWDENDFTEFAKILITQGALSSSEQYLKTIPHGGFYLHFLPFLQGMLYVGNTNQLSEEEISLIQSLADAFSTAYARYEDFNKLEAAKKQVDKTLVELKQTQQQLVQSEKMASLGELTAGIAHEIQNPLNFVNNFSEVTNELIDEMKEDLATGNLQQVTEIIEDIKQNLEKINHHGKRADAIVKNMLQHSRKNSGQKEPTDINALCDEYIRLSFHGMRAKDKSFNADFKTDFDESIGKINIVSQDIGRALLNLFNNAFYAVKPPNPLKGEHYVPTVSVTTRKITPLQGTGARIEIVVSDNGNGIPQNIIDKIFQPFFTTKPTGQGTGLGLSLAYDIITKEHNGTIKVESKEAEGTTFILQLPIQVDI